MSKDAEFLKRTTRTFCYKNPYEGPGVNDFVQAPFEDANAVSSLLQSGRHSPAIDLDVPHRLVPSTTEGHSHLYIEHEMPWWKYRLMLWGMRVAGVIQPNFYKLAVKRKQSLLRKPGVLKAQSKDKVVPLKAASPEAPASTHWSVS